MEMGAEALVIKQEIKEEDEVCFELISVKEERVLDETEQEESCHLDMIDSQSCFVADGIKEENDIKQEYSNDTERNENIIEEKEINCDWLEPPLNEPDPLAVTKIESTRGAVNFEAAESSSSSNSIGSPRLTENNCGHKKYKSAYSSSLTRNETHGLTHQPTTHIEERIFKCNECNYSCNLSSSLKYHKMTHSWEHAFNCDECDYSSNLLSALKYHKMTHTGEHAFNCSECDYSCNLLSTLKYHKMTHTGEHAFKCSECNYSCNQLSSLKDHMITKYHMVANTEIKPFKCNKCDYTCNELSYLKTHNLTHTKKKSFKCRDCSYSCNRLSKIKDHRKKHT